MANIKKSFCIIYDTFLDMIKDTDIKPGMVTMTLGHDKINDNKGSFYKICLKSDVIGKKIEYEEFSKKSSLIAMNINSFDTGKRFDEINKNSKEIRDNIKTNNDAIGNFSINSKKSIIEIENKIKTNNELILNDEVMIEYDVSNDQNSKLRFIRTHSGYKLLVIDTRDACKFDIIIDDNNKWILPFEFIYTKLNVLNVSKNTQINYTDNVLSISINDRINELIKY